MLLSYLIGISLKNMFACLLICFVSLLIWSYSEEVDSLLPSIPPSIIQSLSLSVSRLLSHLFGLVAIQNLQICCFISPTPTASMTLWYHSHSRCNQTQELPLFDVQSDRCHCHNARGALLKKLQMDWLRKDHPKYLTNPWSVVHQKLINIYIYIFYIYIS